MNKSVSPFSWSLESSGGDTLQQINMTQQVSNNNREASSGLSTEAAQRTKTQSARRTRDRWCWGWEGSMLGAGNNIWEVES